MRNGYVLLPTDKEEPHFPEENEMEERASLLAITKVGVWCVRVEMTPFPPHM